MSLSLLLAGRPSVGRWLSARRPLLLLATALMAYLTDGLQLLPLRLTLHTKGHCPPFPVVQCQPWCRNTRIVDFYVSRGCSLLCGVGAAVKQQRSRRCHGVSGPLARTTVSDRDRSESM